MMQQKFQKKMNPTLSIGILFDQKSIPTIYQGKV
jgi:hypothetical protein